MKIIYSLLLFYMSAVYALPVGFVYLQDVDPTILQDMRYAGAHNFIGRPVKGYKTNQCILTKEAAYALKNVQKELLKKSLSLKVYDCYRPTRSVVDFLLWSKDTRYQEMKREFYPNTNKADLFKLGYVAEKSGHSRGSTVDLTIVPKNSTAAVFHMGQQLVACTAAFTKRYRDNSIDMGTGYDCMDELSHVTNLNINQLAYQQRMLLHNIMIRHDFVPYVKEWWHFTLKNEPYPSSYFDFIVR